jgi:hypothetical protein
MSERNKENVLHTVKVKEGIVHIIDHQLVLVLIMMDIFRPKRIEVIVYDVSKTRARNNCLCSLRNDPNVHCNR